MYHCVFSVYKSCAAAAESQAAITEQLRQEREGVVRLLNYTSLGVAFENLVYVAPIRQNGRNTLYFGAHAAVPLWEDPKVFDGKSKKGSSGKDKDKKKSSKKKSSAASASSTDAGLLEEAPPTPTKAARVKIASVSSATSNVSDMSGGGGAGASTRSSSSGGGRLISVASSGISNAGVSAVSSASEQLFPHASRCRVRSQTTDNNKPFGESYRANTAPMFFMSAYLRGQLLVKSRTADASSSAAAAASGVAEFFATNANNTEVQLQFEMVRDVIGDRDDECFIGLEFHEPLAHDWAAHWVNKTLIATAREFRASSGGDGGDKSASAASAPTVSAHFSAGRYRSNTISSAVSSSSALASTSAAAASASAKSPAAKKPSANDQSAVEYPHVVYPFGAMFDRVVVTDVSRGGAEARQAMPALTLGAMVVPKSEFNTVYDGGDEEVAALRPRPGFIYTMTVATSLFDLENCASNLLVNLCI